MIDYRRAMALQRKLAEKVLAEIDSFKPLDTSSIGFIAGVDAGYRAGEIYGVAVLLEYSSTRLLTYSVVRKKPPIPYIPGLLAFREAPAYIAALRKLPWEPDIIFVDGHGLTHPRALGIATHIGLVLDKPSIGVAKKRLYGEEVEENGRLYVYAHGVKAGAIIEHRGKRLYVSIGYKITLKDALEITRQLLTPQHKLPLPTAIADQITKKLTRKKHYKTEK